MAVIRVYTRPIQDKVCDAGVANSVHFELQEREGITSLNQGYGILYPEGRIREDNTIDPRGVVDPHIEIRDQKFCIYGTLVNEEGTVMDPDHYYTWITEDLVQFTTVGLVDRAEFIRTPEDTVPVPDELLAGIRERWIPAVVVSDQPQDPLELYPLDTGYADPVVFSWEGKWYLLSTNDRNGNIGVFMREADTVAGLFQEGYRVSVILDYNEERNFIQTFWAPEWHIIGGVPYILLAIGGRQWAPQSHMMKYKGSGSIMDPKNWEVPVRVTKKDGTYLQEAGITLDMTYAKVKDRSFVFWSERYHIGTPLDSGSMIYMAEIDAANPCRLISDPVLLTRPLYGWENVRGTINNEGPYPLIHEDRLYLAYSGGDARGHYYAVGYMILDMDKEPLDPASWTKLPAPVLFAESIPGVDGPGHNSFFVDEQGAICTAFHGYTDAAAIGIHKVYFNKEGFPMLNAVWVPQE